MKGTVYTDDGIHIRAVLLSRLRVYLKAALLTHNYVMSTHDLRIVNNLKLHSTHTHQMAVVSQMSIAYSNISSTLSPVVQNASFQMDIFSPRIKDSIFLPSLQLEPRP